MIENPLKAWLDRRNMTPYAFAQSAGIAQRTAYRIAQDETFRASMTAPTGAC